MILTVFEERDGVEFAYGAGGRVFAKPLDAETWRYVVVREVDQNDQSVIASLTTAPIASLTC